LNDELQLAVVLFRLYRAIFANSDLLHLDASRDYDVNNTIADVGFKYLQPWPKTKKLARSGYAWQMSWHRVGMTHVAPRWWRRVVSLMD